MRSADPVAGTTQATRRYCFLQLTCQIKSGMDADETNAVMLTKLVRFGCRLFATATFAALVGCGGSGGGAATEDPKLRALDVQLVDSTPADPAWINGSCVIFAPRLNAVDLLVYWLDPAQSTMTHIGYSMRRCIDGHAEPYVSSWDPFFVQTVWIDVDGDCPTGVSCYWPSSSVIMLDQTAIASRERTADFVDSLLGHELYHAIAGYYHP
jgi:hypothetical protein